MHKITVFILFFLASAQLLEAQMSTLVPIKGNYLYTAPAEVSNKEYLAFLANIEPEAKREALTPDTLVWLTEGSYNEPFVETYFRHPAYSDYPVAGIDHSKAMAYCAWLEKQYNEALAKDLKDPRQQVRVRLPTVAEWEMAARAGLDESAIFPWEGDYLQIRKCPEILDKYKKYEGMVLANFKRGRGNLSENGHITAPVLGYLPSPSGLYNMAGNVAELVQDSTLVKGGGWNSTGFFLQISAQEAYTGASANVGFRVFVEVVEWKASEAAKALNLTAAYIEASLVNFGNEKLLGGNTEVTNELYNCFLAALKTKDAALAKSYSPNSALWEKEVGYANYNAYDWHKDYAQHPVVNIPQEAAIAFCSWLTEKYHSFPKRKYQKLEFRLPSEKEWMDGASGQVRAIAEIAPSAGNLQNSKGCFLINFNPFEEKYRIAVGSDLSAFNYPNDDYTISRSIDGFIYSNSVKIFYPNKYGFYNLCGNVAEMVAEPGISKGGSWKSTVTALAIDAQETYDAPSPVLGFRYFVERLEE
jgi:formylglycine-generating enzyme required for sulfatase activity